MKKLSLFFILLVSMNSAFAQTNDGVNELKENIHLHLNKTKFLRGERLWFKAYVWDQKRKVPSIGSTNLHVGIYNDNGEEIKRKLLLIESGMAQGDFAIDSMLTDSEYTILAWTNNMRNYKQLSPFQQRIQIFKNGVKSDASQKANMRLSIYPEGGQLIEGTYNNIGIFIENGLGQGVQVNNLELLDDKGKRIRHDISTNSFGMGKTSLLVEPGKSYFLEFQREGLPILRQSLPKATIGQLGLSINNYGKEQVLFRLVSSKEIFSAKTGDNYTIGVYQDDFLLLNTIKIDEREPVISIMREQLPFGTLVATLFDTDLRPVAYRMFFNHKKTIYPLEIDHCLTDFGDSLQVDLRVPKNIEEAMVSLSAQPKESLAYGAENSILSSFYLRPYINMAFQDRFFFEGMDRRKRYELDLRLMIEGWGKYNWDSRKEGDARLAFERETGIPFLGRIFDADLNVENEVSLVAELSAAMAFAKLDENKSFEGTMQLFDGDSLGVCLLGKKGKLRKPKAEIKFVGQKKSGLWVLEWLETAPIAKQSDIIYEKRIDEPLNNEDRTIALEEVVVTEKLYKVKKTDMFITNDGIISEGRIIRDADIKSYNSVLGYLSTLGYSSSKRLDADGFFVDVLLNPKNNNPVNVDSRLLSLPLSRVRAIYFDIAKKVYVSIVLRPDAYESPEQRMKFVKFVVENGYARPQSYFSPNYSEYGSKIFKSYGSLDWKPNISLSPEISTTIKIPIKNQKGVQLYIEGMDSKGTLIVHKESIDLQP